MKWNQFINRKKKIKIFFNLLGLIFFFFSFFFFFFFFFLSWKIYYFEKSNNSIRLDPNIQHVWAQFTCTAACITKTIMSRRTCESRGQREGFAGCMVHRILQIFHRFIFVKLDRRGNSRSDRASRKKHVKLYWERLAVFNPFLQGHLLDEIS